MFRIVGLQPQEVEVTQEVFLKFLHPDEVAWILQEIQRSVADEPPTGIEHRIIRPNGEIRNVYSSVKVYRDEHGNPLRMLGSTQDITDRKHMEEAEQQQRTLAETLRNMAARRSTVHSIWTRYLIGFWLMSIGSCPTTRPTSCSSNLRTTPFGSCAVEATSERGLGDFTRTLRLEMAQLPVLPKASLTRQPIIVPDTQQQPGWQQLSDVSWIRSYLCAPICVRDQAIGLPQPRQCDTRGLYR